VNTKSLFGKLSHASTFPQLLVVRIVKLLNEKERDRLWTSFLDLLRCPESSNARQRIDD
jgi:hypothetical protein